MTRFTGPERLASGHVLDGFACGRSALDLWLIHHARQAAGARSARTYVIVDSAQSRVVGYHALAAASVERSAVSVRVGRGMARHPIPVVLLARLAVDMSVGHRGLGAWLLRDAMTRTLAAADTIAVRAMLVHAIDEPARAFYMHHGLEASPSDPLHLMILTKDIATALAAVE